MGLLALGQGRKRSRGRGQLERRQRWPPEHPRRDDRRHGRDRRLQFMPNVRAARRQKGTTFTDAVDSFPLCCPARATFITGQYAAQPRRRGELLPLRLVRDEAPREHLPAWLEDAGYQTALIGKWLNGYGALDAHGEVPIGFDLARPARRLGLRLLQLRDEPDGKLQSWGDPDFARKLVEFANIEVTPNPGGWPASLGEAARGVRPAALHLLGRREAERTTRPTSPADHRDRLVRQRAQLARSRSSSGGRPQRRTARTSRRR